MNEGQAGEKIAEINANCASLYQFKRRFFDYFNAFRVLKFLNYIHESALEKNDVSVAVRMLFSALDFPCEQEDVKNLLFFRECDKKDG